MVRLHGGVQPVAVKLVHIMFSLLEAFACEKAFSLIVNLQHVVLGFLFGPAKNNPKDVRHVLHQVYRVVPANHQIAGLQFVAWLGLLFFTRLRQRQWFCGLRHGKLAGGIYGVAIGGLFAGESMFHRVSNASKVALYFLMRHLRERGFVLFDIQMLTPITQQLGAIDIPREDYLARLAKAINLPVLF